MQYCMTKYFLLHFGIRIFLKSELLYLITWVFACKKGVAMSGLVCCYAASSVFQVVNLYLVAGGSGWLQREAIWLLGCCGC